MSKTFKGKRSIFGNQIIVTCNDWPLELHTDLVNHSPLGFEWGYNGSGPRQLALAIMAETFEDDDIALAHYEQFANDIIFSIHDRKWEMTSDDVIAWFEKTTGKVLPAQTDITAHAAMVWDKLRSQGLIKRTHEQILNTGNWDKDALIMISILKNEFSTLPEVQQFLHYLGGGQTDENNIVKRACKELGITQKELAERLDVQPTAVSNWANGQIPKMAQVALEQMLELKECKDKLQKIKEARDIMASI